jgi:hypothetical protein
MVSFEAGEISRHHGVLARIAIIVRLRRVDDSSLYQRDLFTLTCVRQRHAATREAERCQVSKLGTTVPLSATAVVIPERYPT